MVQLGGAGALPGQVPRLALGVSRAGPWSGPWGWARVEASPDVKNKKTKDKTNDPHNPSENTVHESPIAKIPSSKFDENPIAKIPNSCY